MSFEDKSILEYLEENMTDSGLPRYFGLPAEMKNSRLPFADGAEDGIAIYHMGSIGLDEETKALFEELLCEVSEGKFDVAEQKLAELAEHSSALDAIDDLPGYILDNEDRWNPDNLYHFAVGCIFSSRVDFVKYGLEILGIFDLPEELKNWVRKLGYCNEFTLYAICNMLKWNNANDEIFELAQRVYGWGRIHAVRFLQPSGKEIRDWLLKEGVNNDVLASYSALDVYEKADVRSLLRTEMTEEEVYSTAAVIRALLEEGPVFGISVIEDADQMLLDFLNQAERFESNSEIHELIEKIKF